MKILGIGEYMSLGAMYQRLSDAGHEVKVFVEESEAHGIFAGIVPRCADWRRELDWIREAGDDGVIVFESASKGDWQDELRRDGFGVIGSSEWGDRLENDRAFGQGVLRDAGLSTAATYEFTSFDAADEFLARHPARYVYKLSSSEAASTRNYIGQLDNAADLRALLRRERDGWRDEASPRFILMQHLRGVEVGIGGYFDGTRFLEPVCLDWEHKRFFAGDLGELTGEMGTVVTYRGYEPLFAKTLALCAEALRSGGYVGYINLNTIVNEAGIWPLEFTTRFGYPGYVVCDALHEGGWDAIFRKLLGRDRGGSAQRFATRDGFAVGVVLTVPPFPYEYGYEELSKGAPIFFRECLSAAEQARLYYGEVALDPPRPGGQPVCSGSLGYVMVATGCGAGVPAARDAAYALAGKVVINNVRYRVDIGEHVIRHDLAELRRLGLYG